MTTKNAFGAAGPGMSKNRRKPSGWSAELTTKLGDVRARMAQVCEWFDLEPVNNKTRGNRVVLSDEVNLWAFNNGINLDWLYTGTARALILGDRRRRQKEDEFLLLFNSLTPENKKRALAKLGEMVEQEILAAQASL